MEISERHVKRWSFYKFERSDIYRGKIETDEQSHRCYARYIPR